MERNNRHYCYRIDFVDGFVYFGVRSCSCDPAEDTSYMGSPRTYKAKWLTDVPRVKTIVSVHATRELAEIAEDELILAFWAVSKPLSLNASVNGAKFHRLGAKHTEEACTKMSEAATGKQWYTNGATDVLLGQNDTAPAGLIRGRADSSTASKGSIWYTNGTDSIMLKPGSPVPEGFELGRAGAMTTNKGTIWCTNGTQSLRLDSDSAVPEGFRPGIAKYSSVSCKGTRWYTDGTRNLRLRADASVPEGFRPGRTSKS